MVSPQERQHLLDDIRAWCRQHLKVSSLEEAEELAVAISREVGQVIVEEGVQQVDERESYEGCSVACACGRRARFKGYRGRWLVTLAGAARVKRAYYYCSNCGTGMAPWDGRQGLSSLQWTPGVKRLVGQFVGRLTYGETVELLALSTGLSMAESCAEEVVMEVGGRLRGQEAQLQAEVFGGDVMRLVPDPGGRVYVGVDGTYAHIDGTWHEVKAGVVYGAKPGREGIDEATKGHYLAAQETAEEFGERVYAVAASQGVEQATEQIVIGDGAEWIWNLAAHHFPKATQIVDYWHACEHIWNLRRALYPEQSSAGDRWVGEHCRELAREGPDSLLRSLRRLKPKTQEAAEVVRIEWGYFNRHRGRMAYPQFRARGLMIGSGPVESGCKVVVEHRLKRAGMRWSRRGADVVLAVRCALLNKDTEGLSQAAKAA